MIILPDKKPAHETEMEDMIVGFSEDNEPFDRRFSILVGDITIRGIIPMT